MKGAEAVSNERVDVLAVMDKAARDLWVATEFFANKAAKESGDEMAKARAAVAELIEAQRKAHDAMLLADWNVPSLCSERKHAAYIASAAILSRIGGAPGALPELPLLQFAVFDEFGKGADDRVQDYGSLCYERGYAAASLLRARAYAEQCRAGVWLPASTAPDGDCLEFPIWVAWNNGRVDYVDECACVDYTGCIGWMKVIPPAPPANSTATLEAMQ